MSRIWRLEDIDPDDPEQRFLPVLQALPYGPNATPMVFPESIARAISRHLTECGVPPIDPDAATKKLRLPHRGPNTGLNGAITWVPIDDEDAAPPVVIQDPATMTVFEREAVVERLRYQGYRINEPEDPPPTARVVDALDEPPRFDPSQHSVTEVLVYLRELDDDIERGRVLHAERTGQARKGILKRQKGIADA